MKRNRKITRERKKVHIRKNLRGTDEKPRVFLFKSNKSVYVGVANDDSGRVLGGMKGKKTVAEAAKLGENFSKTLAKKKIKTVAFDRSGYKFHGIVKAVAEGLQKGGVKL